MCPDVTGMFVHFLLHLGQHDGYALVHEQTVAAGSLVDVLQIHIPLWSITMQFQNAVDERIRIATGGISQIVLVFVTVLTILVLLQ